MNLKGLDDTDLKLLLLSGSSIFVENIKITPYTIKEIVQDIGYSNYMAHAQTLSLTVEEFIKNVTDMDLRMELEVKKNDLKPFDFFADIFGSQMLESMINSLSVFLRTDDIILIEQGVLAVDFVKRGFISFDEEGALITHSEKINEVSDDELTFINRDIFEQIVQAIKYQNYLKKIEVKKRDYNPADESARLLVEQMEANKKRVEEKKRREVEDSDDEIDIGDIMSAISSKSNSLNKLNIWDLTLFQMYDEYSRLEIIDSYKFSIQAMMAGAENVQIKHWSSRI